MGYPPFWDTSIWPSSLLWFTCEAPEAEWWCGSAIPLGRLSNLSHPRWFAGDNRSKSVYLRDAAWKAFNLQSGMIWNRLERHRWVALGLCGWLLGIRLCEATSVSWSRGSPSSRPPHLKSEGGAPKVTETPLVPRCCVFTLFTISCWIWFLTAPSNGAGALVHLKDCNSSKSEQHWRLSCSPNTG